MSGKIILRAPSGGSVALKVADTAIDTEVVVHGDSIGGGIGVNQTWQDVTSSRVVDTTYTNNTGQTITVIIGMYASAASQTLAGYVDGLLLAIAGYGGSAVGIMYGQITLVVPNGSTYRVGVVEGSPGIRDWSELRGD